jgi:hypothetical protein
MHVKETPDRHDCRLIGQLTRNWERIFMRSRFAMMRKAWRLATLFGVAFGTHHLASAASLDSLAGFGGGDGWRAPLEVISGDAPGTDTAGSYNYLANASNLERGFAYNPATGNLILASRSPAGNGIRILNGRTGADIGALNQSTGVIGGGTFAYNMVGVADDGAIYVANLAADTASNNYKIYRWENEAALAPTIAFQGVGATAPLPGTRMGDSFDVIGSGVETRLVAGYGSASVPGNGFALFDTDDGVNYTATSASFASDPPFTTPPAGEFRLGVTFRDNDTVIGKSTINPATVVDVAGATATVVEQHGTDGISLRPMDFAIVDGRPLLAVVEVSNTTNAPAKARLFVYDMTNPSLPTADRKIAEGSLLASNQNANANEVGQVKFGAIEGNVATIYAMSSNNGIEAFTLTLDAIVPPAADADFNGDLVVDGTDFLIWQRGFGLSAQVDKSTGDADGDGNVNDADLMIWSTQFGTTITPPAIGAVPEPATLALTAAGVACLAFRRRNN